MRLIDADEVEKELISYFWDTKEANALIKEIEKIPTYAPEIKLVERPIERGEWVELPRALNSPEIPCECSECEHVAVFVFGFPKSKYCPNCGAKIKNSECTFWDNFPDLLGRFS